MPTRVRVTELVGFGSMGVSQVSLARNLAQEPLLDLKR